MHARNFVATVVAAAVFALCASGCDTDTTLNADNSTVRTHPIGEPDTCARLLYVDMTSADPMARGVIVHAKGCADAQDYLVIAVGPVDGEPEEFVHVGMTGAVPADDCAVKGGTDIGKWTPDSPHEVACFQPPTAYRVALLDAWGAMLDEVSVPADFIGAAQVDAQGYWHATRRAPETCEFYGGK